MFSLEQSTMDAMTDNSSDPQRLKRPLSVIEEHLDEDPMFDGAGKVRTGLAAGRGDCRSLEKHSRTGNDSHLKINSVRKTRKKVVFSPQSPVLICHARNSSDDSLKPIAESESPHSSPEVTSQHTESGTEGDLTLLKDTATKLNLKTRRQSYLTWRAEYVDKSRETAEVKVACRSGGRLTAERKDRIDKDLQWIKGQLVDIRRQDQSLARQLLCIRHELSNLRLAVSCEEHRDLLDDAHDHMEELRELSRLVDFPPELPSSSPLRQIGVTKMNLSSRRFSTC